jgi:hypothetical protein
VAKPISSSQGYDGYWGGSDRSSRPFRQGRYPRNCVVNTRDLQRPLNVGAVPRRRFPVGASPTRQPLQPQATGVVLEVTKWLEGIVTSSVFTAHYLPTTRLGFNKFNGLGSREDAAIDPLLARCDNAPSGEASAATGWEPSRPNDRAIVGEAGRRRDQQGPQRSR